MWNNERKSLSENDRNFNSKIIFKDYFKTLKNKYIDSKCLFFCSDSYYNLSYILTDPLIIVQTDNLAVVDKLKLSDKIKLDRDNKILSFYYDRGLFILVIDKQTIYIYSLANTKGNLTNVHEHQTNLKDNEEIFKISLLNNEQNSTYFIYTTTLCRTFFMRISPRIVTYNALYEYEIIEEELKEKGNIIKSLLNFVKPNRTIENSFILNPNPKKFLKSINDLNRVFVLTDTTIQRIDFSISNFKVTYEITPQTHISNILIDNLKAHLKTNMNLTSKNYCIEAADIYYDSVLKVSKLYCVLKLSLENKYYFYFYHFDLNNFNEISQISISYIEGADINSIYRVGLFVNKSKNEGFIIFSYKNSTQVCYFSDHDKNRKPLMITHNMKFDINGLSNLNFKEFLEIYLFSFNEGLFNIYLKDEQLYDSDKTDELMNKLTEKGEDLMITFSMSNRKHHSVDNSVLLSDENGLYEQFNDALFNHINKKLSKIEEERLKLKLNEMKIELKLSILEKTILARLDDETENIDLANRESTYAELSIIDYLKEKEIALLQIQCFCDFIDLFGSLDENHKLFLCFLTYMEKLSLAIELRKIENILAQEYGFHNLKYVFPIVKQIFQQAFDEIKIYYESIARSKSFVKRSLYSKISKIDKYLKEIFRAYKKIADLINIGKDVKLGVTLFLLNVWNQILEPIKDLHNKYAEKLKTLHEIAGFNQNYLWLIEQSFLSNLGEIFDLYIRYEYCKISENESKFILIFCDNLLYLNQKYYSIYCNDDNLKKWEEIKTSRIQTIYKKNYEYALNLAEKYVDFYSIVKICYDHKLINNLKQIMLKSIEFTRFALRQYLILEIKSNTNNVFTFFENFSEFRQEMNEISNKFPKIALLYRLYQNFYDHLNYSDTVYFAQNVNMQNKLIFGKIVKLMNCISEKNLASANLNMMEEDNPINEAERTHLESNFYLILNHLKVKFNMPKSIYNLTDIVDLILKLDHNYFDGVISKKYLVVLQLLLFAKDIPKSTLSNTEAEHYEKLESTYNKLMKFAIIDDIKKCHYQLQNFKTNFGLENFIEFSDEQKKFFIKNTILEILKEKFNIDLKIARDYLNSEEILKEVEKLYLEEYINIFNYF